MTSDQDALFAAGVTANQLPPGNLSATVTAAQRVGRATGFPGSSCGWEDYLRAGAASFGVPLYQTNETVRALRAAGAP